MHQRHRIWPLILLGIFAGATPARAELVFFANGRSLSVKGHRSEGDTLVLTLRSGGEVACDPAVIARIAQDEVPYPEPDATPDERSVQLQADVRPKPAATTDPTNGAAPYADIIGTVAAREGIDVGLVRAVIQVESAYQTNAQSPKGAMGLMQLMPETARRYAVADPYDPVANVEAGIKHLKSLLARFPRDLALAAYNAGDAAVRRFHGMPPYPETRSYVSRILSLLGR